MPTMFLWSLGTELRGVIPLDWLPDRLAASPDTVRYDVTPPVTARHTAFKDVHCRLRGRASRPRRQTDHKRIPHLYVGSRAAWNCHSVNGVWKNEAGRRGLDGDSGQWAGALFRPSRRAELVITPATLPRCAGALGWRGVTPEVSH